jgi:transcriptional antiterminator Rof (Rho-off)
MRNQAIGRCDILDVLEEAAIFRKCVRVELHDDEGFTARVRDVYTEGGEDYVVFEDHDRMSVSDISVCRTTDDRP